MTLPGDRRQPPPPPTVPLCLAPSTANSLVDYVNTVATVCRHCHPSTNSTTATIDPLTVHHKTRHCRPLLSLHHISAAVTVASRLKAVSRRKSSTGIGSGGWFIGKIPSNI
ncbi:DNA polymerase III [Striga asiatica]|uniref:DNA polymerase III n=1 Tax=Striga asiatica TaxID=4170 RepID=A0A5A7QGV8_STRAF|nr:DNA polymerase III [Striga asiatica]